MENRTSEQTEPDVKSDDIEPQSAISQLDKELETTLKITDPSIQLDSASTFVSSKRASFKSCESSSGQRFEETAPCPDLLLSDNKSKTASKLIQDDTSILPRSSNSASDKNCKKSCQLQYGTSEVFHQIVQEQQKIKSSKAHIVPKVFDDPTDQEYYHHMLDDVMLKTFNTEDEQKIFRKALEGMNSNYPEILKGDEQNMFYSPTAFSFSSRIGNDVSCVPDALDDMKESLQSKQSLTKKEERNLRKIRDHLQKLRPELAEQEFVDALARFFYKMRGIFIHSLKLEDHLKVLTNKAREYRRQNKSIGFGLTDFEERLREQLNISSQILVDTADTVITNLFMNPKASNTIKINGRVVLESIKAQLKGNDRMYVMKLFKPAKVYTIDQVREGVMLGKFESECRVAGENDLFLMLPDSKLILCVEIKRHMKCKDGHTQSTSSSHIDKNMISASQQLKKNAQFIASKHGAILSPEWQFAKVCAISPSVYNPDKICSSCKKFILTTDIIKAPGGLDQWWKETGLSERATMFDQKSKDKAYQEFQLFFNRMICMSSVRVIADHYNTWTQVQGNNHHQHMGAGGTQAPQGINGKAATDGLDFENDVLQAVHHAYKILFFTKNQMELLTTDNFPSLIFIADFGAGKSLICKEKCIQKYEYEINLVDEGLKSTPDPVFFLSLVGGGWWWDGKVDDHEHLFDIFTKLYDFSGCKVQVLSAQDLWTFYQSENEGAKGNNVSIYDLVEFFIQHHPNGHFIIDECPFLRTKGTNGSGSYNNASSVKRLTEFLTRCRQQLENEEHLLWVSLQSNLLADLSYVERDFENALQEMKEEMNRNGWILPTLEANMRNQVNIANVQVEKGDIDDIEMESSIKKLPPGSSLIGEIPILFKVHYVDWDKKKEKVLKHCIDLMSQKSEKNTVVLWDDDDTFKDVADDIKRVIKEKRIVSYPSKQSKEEGISNVKQFVEKSNHILVTKNRYFNGCESANVILLTCEEEGVRNSVLRGVQNFICIQLTMNDQEARISGMKEDNRFS